MGAKPYTMDELEEWAQDAMEQGGVYPGARLVATVEVLEETEFLLHYHKAVNLVLEKTVETLQKEMKKGKKNGNVRRRKGR